MGLIVLGIGLLHFVLDKGEQNDWLSSNVISVCLAISIEAFVLLVIWQKRDDGGVIINSCINNAIIDTEGFNPYAQTEGKRRSS